MIKVQLCNETWLQSFRNFKLWPEEANDAKKILVDWFERYRDITLLAERKNGRTLLLGLPARELAEARTKFSGANGDYELHPESYTDVTPLTVIGERLREEVS